MKLSAPRLYMGWRIFVPITLLTVATLASAHPGHALLDQGLVHAAGPSHAGPLVGICVGCLLAIRLVRHARVRMWLGTGALVAGALAMMLSVSRILG